MAKTKASSSLPLVFLLMMFLSLNPGGTLKVVNGDNKTWCIVNAYAKPDAVQGIIDFICGQIDCSIIKNGGACYVPNNVYNHASAVMNIYYQSHGRKYDDCRFNGNGLVAYTDPSYGSCRYQ